MTSPSSRSSYLGVSPAADALRRIIFGYHSKTKRSISEEAESGDEESVNSWIKDGADPNEKDAYGYTPLINACANGRLKAVQNLVNCSDTNIDFKGPHGYTALHAAAQNGHCAIVKFLLKSGANINAQNDDQDTSIHLALREHHLEIVNELLKNGANTNINGFNNKTFIQCAQEAGLNLGK